MVLNVVVILLSGLRFIRVLTSERHKGNE